MVERILSILLIVALVNITGPGLGWADSKADKQAQVPEKVKADVAKLSREENAAVTVRLRDKTELRGYTWSRQGMLTNRKVPPGFR